jgi:hypothetical protein
MNLNQLRVKIQVLERNVAKLDSRNVEGFLSKVSGLRKQIRQTKEDYVY